MNERKILGALFFFNRDDADCRNPRNLFPTLAMQLKDKVHPYKKALYDSIQTNQSLDSRAISEQFKILFLDPLRTTQSPSRQKLTFVIVIDALDEYENENNKISVIVEQLPKIQREKIGVNLRFFVTGRPDI
ncbi:uncharacterized protein BDV14DRAFT_203974 [Aspergillus stella-maris]|uniref:uncharacterized protein n=1 Tax=Aspergillus stella-maris TaxID=1810926 RepID=UPI003CCD0778